VLALERQGVKLSVSSVLAHGAVFFLGKTVIPRRGETPEEARERKVVQILEDFAPRVVCLGSQPGRLVMSKPVDGEESKPVSKLLGESIGLAVAREISQIPLNQWVPRAYSAGVYHDAEATGMRGKVVVEVRGRYNGNNLGTAVDGIHAKFSRPAYGPQRSFSRAIGVVYNIRSDVDDGVVPFTDDVVIVDPEGTMGPPPRTERWRNALRHYSWLAAAQGLKISVDLAELADLPERDLLQMERQGWARLSPPTGRTADAWARSWLNVGGMLFGGSIWGVSGEAPVRFCIGKEKAQYLYWGLSIHTMTQLMVGDFSGLVSTRWRPRVWMQDDLTYCLEENGSIIIASPDLWKLMAHP
jgi:hypothetical protein